MAHNLTNAEKKACINWCKEMLTKYVQGRSKAVHNIFTGDKSWIYAYKPETKQKSTVYKSSKLSKIQQKLFKARSTSKQMVACFSSIIRHVTGNNGIRAMQDKKFSMLYDCLLARS